MPSVDRAGPYRVFFYSLENGETPHVPIWRDRAMAKVGLDPVAMANSKHFGDRDLAAIMVIVRENSARYLDKWHCYFGTSR